MYVGFVLWLQVLYTSDCSLRILGEVQIHDRQMYAYKRQVCTRAGRVCRCIRVKRASRSRWECVREREWLCVRAARVFFQVSTRCMWVRAPCEKRHQGRRGAAFLHGSFMRASYVHESHSIQFLCRRHRRIWGCGNDNNYREGKE